MSRSPPRPAVTGSVEGADVPTCLWLSPLPPPDALHDACPPALLRHNTAGPLPTNVMVVVCPKGRTLFPHQQAAHLLRGGVWARQAGDQRPAQQSRRRAGRRPGRDGGWLRGRRQRGRWRKRRSRRQAAGLWPCWGERAGAGARRRPVQQDAAAAQCEWVHGRALCITSCIVRGSLRVRHAHGKAAACSAPSPSLRSVMHVMLLCCVPGVWLPFASPPPPLPSPPPSSGSPPPLPGQRSHSTAQPQRSSQHSPQHPHTRTPAPCPPPPSPCPMCLPQILAPPPPMSLRQHRAGRPRPGRRGWRLGGRQRHGGRRHGGRARHHGQQLGGWRGRPLPAVRAAVPHGGVLDRLRLLRHVVRA